MSIATGPGSTCATNIASVMSSSAAKPRAVSDFETTAIKVMKPPHVVVPIRKKIRNRRSSETRSTAGAGATLIDETGRRGRRGPAFLRQPSHEELNAEAREPQRHRPLQWTRRNAVGQEAAGRRAG